MTPSVAVIVPVQDEAGDISRCLGHLCEQTLGPDEVEVIVVDGGSTDGTPGLARSVLAAAGFSRAEVIELRNGTTPGNLNRGLAHVTAPLVCRVDARSLVPPQYLERCVELLTEDPGRSVVGGAQVATSRAVDARSTGIARALNNRWAMGGSRYRRSDTSGPTETVYLGAFRTAQLRAVGGWDERLGTNQDFDLNRRLGQRGVVWFDAALRVGYLPRADVRSLFRQYRRFGRWKVRYWRLTADRPQVRQVVLLCAPLLVACAGLGALALAPPRGRALLVAGAVLGAAVVEGTGTTGPAGGPAARAWSVLASGAISSGWLTGAWQALLTGERAA